MDITIVIEALISLAVVLVTVVIIPLLVKKYGAENTQQIAYWISVAVSAAEQIYKGVKKAGKDKKNYVLEFLQKNGITYNAEKIDALIEAEVRKLGGETYVIEEVTDK